MDEKKNKRSVIHLEKDGQHYYFGNVKAIFEIFTPQEIGAAYGTLRNYGISESNPYQNKFVIIRKGTLFTIPKINN